MSKRIAKEIIRQIKVIDRGAIFVWGAKDFLYLENGVTFKTSGVVKWKGHVTIRLNSKDYYDVSFHEVRGTNISHQESFEDVFAEDLVNIINDKVG